MENNYIQQLRQILTSEYQVNPEELEAIIEDYGFTVETIIDETGDEKAVVDQLGAPRVLADEIAKEFNFARRIKPENQEWSHSKTYADPLGYRGVKGANNAMPNWLKIILIVVAVFVGFPIVSTIGGIVVSGIIASMGLVVAGIVLAPNLFSETPMFVVMLFMTGIATLILMFFVIATMIKGIIYLINKFSGKNKMNEQPRKKWGLWTGLVLLVVVLIGHGSLFAIVATSSGLRDKIPYNMYTFRVRKKDASSVEKKEVEKKEVRKLNLKGSGASFDLTESTDDEYHVTVYKDGKEVKNVVVIENNELKVDLNSGNNNCFMCIDFGNVGSKVKVEVPKNANLESIFLEITGGEANLKNLVANQVEMRLTGGSIHADTVDATDISVTVTGGESKFERINTKTSKFYVSGGSIDIKTLKADNSLFDVTGGSINVRKGDIGKVERNINGGSVDIG